MRAEMPPALELVLCLASSGVFSNFLDAETFSTVCSWADLRVTIEMRDCAAGDGTVKSECVKGSGSGHGWLLVF